MRFGIPQYRLPRDVLDAEIQRILDMGVRLHLGAKVTDLRTVDACCAASTPPSSPSGPISPSAPISRPERQRRSSMPSRCCARWKASEQPLLGRRVVVYGGGNTALDVARTAKRLGATEADHRLSPHARPHAGARFRGRGGARGRRDDALAIDHQAHGRRRASPSRRWCSTPTGFPQPTGELETLEADLLVLALGQDVDLSLLDDVPGLDGKDGVIAVGPNMMTGHARHLRGRRHGAVRAHRDGRGRPRQEGRAPHRRLAATDAIYRAAAEARACGRRQAEHLVLRGRAEDGAAGARHAAPALDLRRGAERPRRNQRALRGAPLPILRQLLRMRQLLRRLPGQRRRSSSARARASRFNYDYCKGCGVCAEECPCGAIAMVPEAI